MLKITVSIWALLSIFCSFTAESIANEVNKLHYNWTSYQTLDAIENFLDDILEKYPDVTKNVVIGQSYENRSIRAIEISYKSNNPGIYIEGTIHAREWVVPATTTWLINELLSSKDPVVRDLAENHNWYIVPVLNVDGYVYSHTTDRDWRKNRQPTGISSCIGIDINRNFDSHWNEITDEYSDACNITYPGAFAFSAPEAKAEADYIISLKNKLNIFFAFHSSGQEVLTAYDYTENKPIHYKDHQMLAKTYVNAISTLEYKTNYTYGQSGIVSYLASGESNNWAYEQQGIKLSFLIEFRDTGEVHDYKLPADQIIPNSIETLKGMTSLINKANKCTYMNVKN